MVLTFAQPVSRLGHFDPYQVLSATEKLIVNSTESEVNQFERRGFRQNLCSSLPFNLIPTIYSYKLEDTVDYKQIDLNQRNNKPIIKFEMINREIHSSSPENLEMNSLITNYYESNVILQYSLASFTTRSKRY